VARETVCLVFTDLVGSTELANRIGPTPAEELRKEHFELLRKASSDAGGREVKNLGDGLMLVFNSSTAALDAAAAAQRAIAARNRRASIRFDVRIGVALGEVENEAGDYFGEAVVQAARLCALAEGGQVLLAEMVKAFASATTHGFVSLGGLELKGLPDPVAAHSLVWDEAATAAIPLPNRLRGAPELVYVGRSDEREAIDRSWREVTGGRESLVLMAGEPGIGKTRLASQHAFAAHAAGATVLYGAVDEGVGLPYQPWIEALSHLVTHVDDATLDRGIERTGADLARLVPALRARRADLPNASATDGETDRYLLFEAVTALLREAAAHVPVLVIVDDLHWADKPTLLMLMHLHRTLSESAIQFVATYRDSELTPDHQLADTLASLRRQERIVRVSLHGLDEAEIVEFLVHTSGQEPTPDGVALAEMLARDTAGNPLFVAEVLRDLLEAGHIVMASDGQWGLATGIERLPTPESVRDVVEQRIRRLGADAQRVLTAAALTGREFELDLLAMVTELDPDSALDTIESAIAGSLVTEAGSRPGVFRFVHALIAQALSDALTATRRSSLHHRIGAGIQTLHGDNLGERITAVARHQLLAGDDPRKVADTCRRAGTYALDALAPDEALRWFQNALDSLAQAAAPEAVMQCDLLADIGVAMRDAGNPNFRNQLMAAAVSAEALGDGERLARPLLALNRSIAISLGTDDIALIGLLDEALRLCARPDAIRARLLAIRAAESGMVADMAGRRVLVDVELAIARELDDATLAAVLVSTLGALMTASTLDERRRYSTELRGLSAGSDPTTHAWNAIHELWQATEAGDRVALEGALEDARSVSGVQPTIRWVLCAFESVLARIDGDIVRSEQLAESALTIATDAGITDGFAAYAISLTDTRLMQGRAGELADLMEQAVHDNPGVPLRPSLANALMQAGRVDAAEEILQAAYDEGLRTLPEGIGWTTNIAGYANVANRCKRRDVAAVLYEMAVPHSTLIVMSPVSCKGALATTLGMLASTMGERDVAVGHFAAADALLDAFGAPLMRALNRYEHGRALLELGDLADRDAAREQLTLARRAYDRYECPVQVAHCDELLATL
jgi:class 3 adenylate cyclase/tetratricopeptide (TPR) repeat protein